MKTLKRVFTALAAIGCFGTVMAATPVVVWDGDFTTMTKGTYTLSENGNTKTDTYLQISGDNGILLTSTDDLNVFTVVARCEGLDLSSANNQVLFTANETSGNARPNLVGVILPSNNAACRGIWAGAAWDPSSTTAGYEQFVQNSVPANYTTLIYNHQQANGTYAYALGPTSDVDETVVCTTLYSILGLRSSGSTYKGFAIGGLRGTTSTTLLPATGLKITSLAVFSGTLSEAEMKAYAFPSEVPEFKVTVSEDKTWNEVLSAAGVTDAENARLVITAENNPKITFDVDSVIYGLTVNGSAVFSAGDAVYGSGAQSLGKTLLSTSMDLSLPNVTFELKDGWKGSFIKSASDIKLYAQNAETISINIGGGDGTADTSAAANLVSGNDYYGLYPTPGSAWNNISGRWQSSKTVTLTSAKAFDGETTTTRNTIQLSGTSGNTWLWTGTSVPFLRGYLDDTAGIQVQIVGVPYSEYDVIIYATSDSNLALNYFTINGNNYTCGSDGIATVGTDSWGVGKTTTPTFGKNAMLVQGVTGETLTISGTRAANYGPRVTVCAVQIINKGDIAANAPVWTNKSGDGSFEDPTNWDTGVVPTSGNVVIEVNGNTGISVAQTHTLGSVTISGSGVVSFAGEGSVTAEKVVVANGATLARPGSIITSAIELDAGTVLRLTETTETAAISGPGAVETYGTVVLANANTMTGGITVKPGSALSTTVAGGYGEYQSGWAYTAQRQVIVEDGGTVDINNVANQDGAVALTIAGKGVLVDNNYAGAVKYSGSTAITSGSRQISSLVLTGDAMVDVGAGWGLVHSGWGDARLGLNGHTLTVRGTGTFPIVNANKASGAATTGTLVLDGAMLELSNSASNLAGVNVIANGCSTINVATAPSALDSLTLKPTASGTTASAWNLPEGLVPVVDVTNIGEPVAEEELTLFTAPATTELSASKINAKINGRYTTTISGNTVKATFNAGLPANFMHYDFNAADSKATDSTYNCGNFNPSLVVGKNGKAGQFKSGSTPWYDSNTAGKSPFHAGEMTVTALLNISEASNTIIWNIGSTSYDSRTGIALIAKNESTFTLVSWVDGGAGSDVVSVTGIDVLNKWHFITVVANANGTTLYVDDKSASVDTCLPAGINARGQFGSIHGSVKDYSAVGADGFLLDDWRVYDAALTVDEVSGIRTALDTVSFTVVPVPNTTVKVMEGENEVVLENGVYTVQAGAQVKVIWVAADGYIVTTGETDWFPPTANQQVTAPEGITVAEIVAKIGDAPYTSLQAALNDADSEGGTEVVLVADVTEDVTIAKAVTITGGENTLTGKLTIQGVEVTLNLAEGSVVELAPEAPEGYDPYATAQVGEAEPIAIEPAENEETLTYAVTAATQIKVSYLPKEITFTVATPENTTVSVYIGEDEVKANQDGSYTVERGETVTVTWNAAEGYIVTGGTRNVEVGVGTTAISTPAEGFSVVQAEACVVSMFYPPVLYPTVQAAIDSDFNASVQLLMDIDTTTTVLTIGASKTVVLDLNGHSIKGGNNGDITVLGNFTLTDTYPSSTGRIYSSVDYGKGHSSGLILVKENGQFTMSGGEIYAVRDNAVSKGQFGVIVEGNGKVEISGGKITAGWYAVGANNTTGSAMTVNISGGTLVSTKDYALYVVGNMAVTLSGFANVSGAAGMAGVRNGSLTITGGTFATSGDGDVGSWTDGTATMDPSIALIDFQADYAASSVTISGGTFAAPAEASCIVVGAKAKEGSTIAISGGTFSSAVPEEFCAEGYIPTTVTGGYSVKQGSYAAQIKETGAKFESLVDAVAAAAEGQTVTLLKQYMETDPYPFVLDKAITLDARLGGTGTPTVTVPGGYIITTAMKGMAPSMIGADTWIVETVDENFDEFNRLVKFGYGATRQVTLEVSAYGTAEIVTGDTVLAPTYSTPYYRVMSGTQLQVQINSIIDGYVPSGSTITVNEVATPLDPPVDGVYTVKIDADAKIRIDFARAGIDIDEEEVVEAETAEEAAAAVELNITVPAGDVATALQEANVSEATYQSYFKAVATAGTGDNEGKWVVTPKLDETKVFPESATTATQETITQTEELLEAATSDEIEEATVPAVPGIYYSMVAANNLAFEEAVEGDQTLATDSTVTIAKPEQLPTGDAVFFRVKASATPNPVTP